MNLPHTPGSFNHVLQAIGNTPLIHLSRLFPGLGNQVYGKFEGMNPGGSIKDRTALHILQNALENGDLKSGGTVIESTSGNMGVGLAQVCLLYKLKLIVVTDPYINISTRKLLSAYGAVIETVHKPDEFGNYLKSRLNRVNQLLEQHPGSYWPNQYKNPSNPQAHLSTINEIEKQLGEPPDYLLIATGTCGTLMGCANYLHETGSKTKVIAVDAEGSVIFDKPAGNRIIPGHGANIKSAFLNRRRIHDVIHVSGEETIKGCHELLTNEALLCGGSSGAVVSGFRKYMTKLSPGLKSVLIFPDRGERYLNTIYDDSWVRKNFGTSLKVA